MLNNNVDDCEGRRERNLGNRHNVAVLTAGRGERIFLMQKIINRKLYNTETAEWVGSYSNMYDTGNFHYYNEKLYRKKTVNGFFMVKGTA